MIQKKFKWLTLIPGLMAPLLLAQTEKDDAAQEPAVLETVVEEKAPENNNVKVTYTKDKFADQQPGDAAMLFHIPGLTLTETGGPLSISQIRYRGLSNARFRIDLEGLSLNNPINGLTDANSLFLFAAKNLQTNAQSLSITLPRVETTEVRSLFGFGSQNATKLGGSFGMPLDPYSSVFVATQLSATDGRYTYSSPDRKNDENNQFTRENNDQHRLQALINYQRKADNSSAKALLAFSAHEGGIAGFAFSPTKNLRNEAIYSGLLVGGSKKMGNANFSLDVANSLFKYRTTDVPLAKEVFTTSAHELTLGFKSLSLPTWIDFDFSQQLVIERAYELKKTRIGGGFLMNRVMKWQNRLKPTVFGHFSMLGFNNQGLIFKNDAGFSFEPMKDMGITARLIRHQRLPTFMEMYAKNRFFVGNNSLEKESVWDIELGSSMRFIKHTHIQVTGFLGYLSDTIVYVPFLSEKLRPINVTSARRYGIDLGLTIEPFMWLSFESKNSLLYTKNTATDAPLPHAPRFMGLSKIRFGTEEIVALGLQSRYRGSATANLYGTLLSKPYTLFDAIVSARPIDIMGLSFSVSNIFNVKTARDSYEIPLPGLTFFGQIEMGNV